MSRVARVFVQWGTCEVRFGGTRSWFLRQCVMHGHYNIDQCNWTLWEETMMTKVADDKGLTPGTQWHRVDFQRTFWVEKKNSPVSCTSRNWTGSSNSVSRPTTAFRQRWDKNRALRGPLVCGNLLFGGLKFSPVRHTITFHCRPHISVEPPGCSIEIRTENAVG